MEGAKRVFINLLDGAGNIEFQFTVYLPKYPSVGSEIVFITGDKNKKAVMPNWIKVSARAHFLKLVDAVSIVIVQEFMDGNFCWYNAKRI